MAEGVHYCRIGLYLSFDLAAQRVNVVLVIEQLSTGRQRWWKMVFRIVTHQCWEHLCHGAVAQLVERPCLVQLFGRGLESRPRHKLVGKYRWQNNILANRSVANCGYKWEDLDKMKVRYFYHVRWISSKLLPSSNCDPLPDNSVLPLKLKINLFIFDVRDAKFVRHTPFYVLLGNTKHFKTFAEFHRELSLNKLRWNIRNLKQKNIECWNDD